HREARRAEGAPGAVILGGTRVDPDLRVDHVQGLERQLSADLLDRGAAPRNPRAAEALDRRAVARGTGAQAVVDHALDRHPEEVALPGPARREAFLLEAELARFVPLVRCGRRRAPIRSTPAARSRRAPAARPRPSPRPRRGCGRGPAAGARS